MRTMTMLAISLSLTSCGGTEVTPVGNDTYIVGTTGMWDAGTELKVKAYQKAIAFCATKGNLTPETISSSSNEVSIQEYPHGEVTFRCVAKHP